MLKPIRVVQTETSSAFANYLAAELSTTLQFILMGHPAELSPFEAFCMPIETYIHSYKKKSVLLKVDVEGDERKVYAFFEFNSAIIMGCAMRQISESITEKKLNAQEFSGPIFDAFGEIGNQFTGALDRILRKTSKANVHLVLDFNKKIFPDESIKIEHFLSKEEYVVWISTLSLGTYGKQKITLLFPQSLYEKIIGSPIELVGVTPKKIMLYSWDKPFAQHLKQELKSRHFIVELIDQYPDIIHLCKDPQCCMVCLDLDLISTPLSHDMKIFGKRLSLTKIHETMPIWVSMRKPSSEALIELEKAGIHGATTQDAKRDLFAWITEQQKNIPVSG